MLILGIDPGLERIGFGLIDKAGSKLKVVDYGLIQTPRIEILQRFLLIERQIQEILEKHPVDLAGCERLFFSKNQTTGIDVAKALGVIQLTIARANVPCMEFSPPQVKQSVVGQGNADKKQIQFMVQKLLGLSAPPRPDDVADALAIAITAAFRYNAPN